MKDVNKPKSGAGRKPKYRLELCEELVTGASDGKTVGQFCVSHRITTTTFYNWCKRYPEFADAVDIAQQALEAFWVRLHMKGALGELQGCNAPMMNKMLEYHAEKMRQKQAGVTINNNTLITNDDVKNLSPEDRKLRLEQLYKKHELINANSRNDSGTAVQHDSGLVQGETGFAGGTAADTACS